MAGSRSQNFTLDLGAVGVIQVVGKRVDVQGGGTAAGTRVQIWTCHGGGSQQWQAIPVPDLPGLFHLRNPQSGRCLRSSSGGSVIEDCPPSFLPQNMVWAQLPQIF